MTDFLRTAELLSTAQAEIAAQVAAITREASTVAALTAVASGQESDAQRVRRLDDAYNVKLGALSAEASRLAGLCDKHRAALAAELKLQKSHA